MVGGVNAASDSFTGEEIKPKPTEKYSHFSVLTHVFSLKDVIWI